VNTWDSFNKIRKILVIDFGQLGDVVMSFPALKAVRERFPSSELVVLAGKVPAAIVRDLRLADRVVPVDRVALLKGPKLRSIRHIMKLVLELRRERFDFVIDLHSLYETNLLGFLSGAPLRLYGNRENRSLDMLSNFRPRSRKEDREQHLAEYYLDVIRPLGIENVSTDIRIDPDESDRSAFVDKYFTERAGSPKLAGLFIGAGHPLRKWELEKFAEIAQLLSDVRGLTPVVFLGPEEVGLEVSIRNVFPDQTVIVQNSTLMQLMAAFSTLQILIGNDTGPTHIAAVTGIPIVMIGDSRAPTRYYPLSPRIGIVRTNVVDEISVDDVWKETERMLAAQVGGASPQISLQE
jgi:ADP-heptose:LPS heptosyltransferase